MAKANPLRVDPTRSVALRRAFISDLRSRFRALKGAITNLIVTEDALGLIANEKAAQGLTLKLNTKWRFETDNDKVVGYQKWLKEQTDAGILQVSGANKDTPWMEPYITSSYKKGAVRAYVDANSAKLITPATPADQAFGEGGKAAFLKAAFDTPAAQGKIRLINTRAFSQLKGVTAEMDQQMSRILAEGLSQGRGAKAIATALAKNVEGLEKKRALVIARTELAYAHSEGQLDSFEALGMEKVGVMAEWNTAHDEKVCFPKNTMVATPTGPRPIQDIETGDLVMTRIGARPVLGTKKRAYQGRMVSFSANGRYVTCTENHPVWVQAKGWAEAKALEVGDTVQLERDELCQIDRIFYFALTETQDVYNLQVAEAPEYFANGVLVHNCKLCAPLEGIVVTVKEARGMIPRHPSCRCAWLPAGVGEHKGGTTKTIWAGPGQGLAEPGTMPTGKVTGQIWSPERVAAQLRDSVTTEVPGLSIEDARKKSKWVGADLTKVTQKLKPGSAAAQKAKEEALAAKLKAAKKMAEERAIKKAAQKAAKEAYEKKVAVALAEMQAEKEAAKAAAQKAIKAAYEKEKILAEIAAKQAAEKAKNDAIFEAIKEAAAKEAAANTPEAIIKAKMGAWKFGSGYSAETLDAADYSFLTGWGAPKPGQKQAYGVLLFDDEGRILLREPAGHYGGAHWTFNKGGGTLPGTTAIKETIEETGHTAAIMDVLDGGYEGTTSKTNYFLGKSIAFDKAEMLKDGETWNTKWMTYDEAKAAINLSDPAVRARDLKVLDQAYATMAQKGATSADMTTLVESGLTKLAEGKAPIVPVPAQAVAKVLTKKEATQHKMAMTKSWYHYQKPKFAGGLTDADYVKDPAGKVLRLNADGVNKVISEKGWSTFSLPDETYNKIMDAKDLVAQKAIIDGLKKAPKDLQKKWPPLKAPAPVAPAPVPKTVAPAIKIPTEAEVTFVKDLEGSTKPWLGKDKDGQFWVIKDVDRSGIDPNHLRSEGLTDELYRRAGVDVPFSLVVDTPSGPRKYAAFIPNGQELGKWRVGKTAQEIADMDDLIAQNFVADALFANHDVAGLKNDNILIANGKPWRIDNGGGLSYRAQGLAKGVWGNKVVELGADSMRSAARNANTAQIFGRLTQRDIEKQIEKILEKRQAILAAISDVDLRQTVAARMDDLASMLPVKAPVRAIPADTLSRAAEYGPTKQAVERAKRGKSNGVTIAGDRGDIEDNNMLAWEELDTNNNPITNLQFKVTPAGSKKIDNAIAPELAKAQNAVSTATSDVHPLDFYWTDIQAGFKTVNQHAVGGAKLKDGLYNQATLSAFKKTHDNIKHVLKTAKDPEVLKMLKYYDKIGDNIEAALAAKSGVPGALQYINRPAPGAVPAPSGRGIRVVRAKNLELPIAKFKKGGGALTDDANRFETGTSYTIDMGDGVVVRYLPNSGEVHETAGRALHGTVRVSIPEGLNEQSLRKAMDRLKDIGIDAAAPTEAYEEALYLHRGVYINKMHDAPSYRKIWNDTSMSDTDKVAALKDWIDKNMGIKVDTVPGYNPLGISKHGDGSGFRHWERWDLPAEKVVQEMSNYTLFHSTKSLSNSPYGAVADTLAGILDSGGEFTTTAGRIRKGVPVKLTGGDSAVSDVNSGGASFFFTRILEADNGRSGFNFRIRNISRQDTISYSEDKFGSISAIGERGSTIADFKKFSKHGGNETIFKEGLSIDDLEFIRVHDQAERAAVLKVFHDRGVKTLTDGRAVEDIVVTLNKMPKQRRP